MNLEIQFYMSICLSWFIFSLFIMFLWAKHILEDTEVKICEFSFLSIPFEI